MNHITTLLKAGHVAAASLIFGLAGAGAQASHAVVSATLRGPNNRYCTGTIARRVGLPASWRMRFTRLR
jgi:hypothetical protein